jgi:zinc protease
MLCMRALAETADMKHQASIALSTLLAVAWLLAPGMARGAGEVPTVPWEVRQESLSNGLKILLLRDTRAPVVTCMVWYRVGARNEHLGTTGLAHLLEHMMFKGTPDYSATAFSNLIQRHGGRHNAFTNQDSTAYFERLAADQLAVVLKLEADRMQNLLLDATAFTLELQVVQEERRLRVDDQPVGFLWEALRATAYQAHPYAWPVIGWSTDLQKLTVEAARQFYETYYVPNNAVLVLVGDFEAEAALARIREYFGPIPGAPAPPAVLAQEPEQHGERRVTVRQPARLPYVAAAYHVPTYAHADAYALDVMGELLGGGQSSRLEVALQRQRQLVFAVGAGYPGVSIDAGLFTLYAQPMPGVPVADVEAALWEEVARLKHTPPAAEELERVKRRLTAEYVLRLDSQFYRALALGQAEMAGSWQWLTTYLARIAAVTASDVQRVARTYLTAENRTVGILEPLPIREGVTPPAPEASSTSPVHGGHIQ